MQLLVDTGLRRSQLFRLEWRDVDTTSRKLAIRNPKDSEDMVLPIPQRTADLLDSLRGGNEFRRYIANTKGYNPLYWPGDKSPTNAVIPFIDIKKQLHKAAKEAGLGEGRTVTSHMLRHTWATRHRRAGTPLDRLMELGGWDSCEMMLRYADVPQDLHDSTDRLEQFPIGAE